MPHMTISYHTGTLKSLIAQPNTLPAVIHGLYTTCLHLNPIAQQLWLDSILTPIQNSLLHCSLTAFYLIAPTNDILDSRDALTLSTMHRLDASIWTILCTTITTPYFGDTVDSPRWICIAHKCIQFSPPHLPAPYTSSPAYTNPAWSLRDCTDESLNNPSFAIQTIKGDTMSQLLASTPTSPQAQPLALALSPQPANSSPTTRNYYILHPDFLAQDPSFPTDGPFGATFGYPFCTTYGTYCIRPFTLPELASSYAIPQHMIRLFPQDAKDSILCCLTHCLPFGTAHAIANTLLYCILLHLTDIDGEHIASDHAHCLQSTPLPTSNSWATTYSEDPDCTAIIMHLKQMPTPPWTEAAL